MAGFLEQNKAGLEDSFGLWKKKAVDGVRYQERLRSEWEPVSELFDTNILIDHLNGIAKATRELKRSSAPAISMITWIEVMTGAFDADEEAILRAFLLNFQCLPVSSAVAERAAVVRRQMKSQDAGCDYSGDG